MIEEDNPPNEYDRKTPLPPVGEVNAKMVQLSLSSMATTLESIERTMRTLERQHESTMRAIEEAKGIANLAGGIASAAREEIVEVKDSCNRVEYALGQLAMSIQGLDERSRSLYDSVFPPRSSAPPPEDIDLADVVPINRRNVMTGE